MNLRRLLLALPLVPVLGRAQTPDVFVRVDTYLTYRSIKNGDTTLRSYDWLGRHSVVGLELALEPGFRGWVSQRLQRIPNDADPEQLDEYYIEDPGLWKLGKQYLPFGQQRMIRENGRAARADTNLLLEKLPISAAVVDNGSGRSRGVIGRLGGSLGLSFAAGKNFAAQGTSLNLVRSPEDAPGVGRGYGVLLGLDGRRRLGKFEISMEAVALRNGETGLDVDMEVSDLALVLRPWREGTVTVGWSRDWNQRLDFYRAQARMMLMPDVHLEPFIRFRQGVMYDLGLTLRVKM
ncbi:MAG TPA: hypothetical protein VEX38_10190 [Fimbriimonadaceae bacterium]|nr:hypothetical protein [Fimbriimonadaceae bacterium]